MCVVSFSQSLGERIPRSYPLKLSLRLGLCRGVLWSGLHTTLLGASLLSDPQCCVSGQAGGTGAGGRRSPEHTNKRCD